MRCGITALAVATGRPADMAKRHASMLESLLAEQARVVRRGQPRKKSPLPKSNASWRCCTCGEVFTTETGAKGYENHADERGHRRIECVA